MVDTTAAAFGMQPATSRGRNVPRRREVDAQTEEAFAAEDQKPRIDYFSLPLGANPEKDEIVGYWDDGTPVYQTKDGTRYEMRTATVPPKEWETEPATWARVGEVAKDYATGAVEGIINAPSEIWGSMEKLSGQSDEPATLGDVFNLAGVPATGAIRGIARGAIQGVDPNVASVFAGLTGYSNYTGKPMRGMADAYDTYAKNYARLRKEAQDNNTFVPEETLKYQASEDTWNQTGFFIGQDGDVRFEIDDSKATITPTKLTEINGYQYARDLIDRNKKTTTLQDFLKHDELFKAYPQLKDLPVFVDNSLAGTNTRGWFDPAKGKNSIALNPDIIGNDYVLNKLGMNTLLHEIQHYIQDIEGFDQGTNLTNPEIIKIYSAETKGIRGKEIQDQYLKDKAAFDAYYTGHKAKVDSDIVDFYTTLLQDKYGVDPSKAIEKFEASAKITEDSRKLYDELSNLKEKSLFSFFSKSKVPSELTSSLAAFLVGDLNANSLVTTAVKRYQQDFNDFFSTNLSADDLVDKTGRYRSPNIGYDVFLPDNIKLPEKPLFIDSSQPFSQSIAQNIYERRSGETESRNVPARKDFTPEKRAATFPRVTEDVLPQYQWTGDELKRYPTASQAVPSASASQLNTFGYRRDNPGGEWLRGKQEDADRAMSEGRGSGGRRRGITGSITGTIGMDRDMFLPTDVLSNLTGLMNERRAPGDIQFDDLLDRVRKEGFDPNQAGNRIVIAVNHRGEAYVLEGNTRLAVARELGIPNVKAEVRYWNGGEDVDSPFSPERVASMAKTEHTSKPNNFAQGGMVDYNTETQMNRLMQEGGIADDGMRRDPVSNNEVPPGSMAEEVRDDIPAQLSSGEYVVPADVLRYYGVAFFEKLRAEAKRGLAEMEAGGRIGGEPVEMEDDLPFDVSELETSGGDNTDMQMAQMGMAQGGVVKMQEGGAMTQPATSTFNPAQYGTVGGSYFQTGAAPTHEYRVYQNAQGQTISILFINGVAQQPIPEGYFPQGQAPQVQQPTPSDNGNDRDERPPEPVKSFSEYTAEDWVKYKPDSGIGGKLGQIAGGVIGGAFLGPAGALLGAKGMEEAMARNSIKAYNAFNDFVGNMNVNDPNYAELAKKRNDIFGELTAKQEEDPGLFKRIANEIFGTTEIVKPKGGRGSGTGGGGGGRTAGGGGAASSRDEGAGAVVTPVTTSRAAAAPAAGGRGTGATATRGTATTRVRDVTALEGPEATSTRSAAQDAARSYKESADEKYGALAKGGLMVKKRVAKKAAKKRPIKTTDA